LTYTLSPYTTLFRSHKRDKNNYRIFDDLDVEWIKGLTKLRECDMSIKDMKKYMELCYKGEASINERKEMLEDTRKKLEGEITRRSEEHTAELQSRVD